jgi:hypothetical protein
MTFPNTAVLGVEVDLNVNGTWTNITSYLLESSAIQITGMGRENEQSTIQPGQCVLLLNNATGRFSPKNSGGAYYPYLVRNVQMRVSINATSQTSVNYTGYRFWGEVSAWDPGWDQTQNYIYTTVTVSGIWRRLSQADDTIGSPMRRYYTITLTGSGVPHAYWPMEDGYGATSFTSFIGSSASGTISPAGGASLASNTVFPGSDSIVTLNGAELTFTVASGGTVTDNVVQFLLSVPAAGDSASGTTDWNLVQIDTGSAIIQQVLVFLNYNGTLQFQGIGGGGVTLWNQATTTNVKGQPYLISVELVPSGSNIDYALRLYKPGASSATESQTGVQSASIGAVTSVTFNRAKQLEDTAVGHLAVLYTLPSGLDAAVAGAANGYSGETALARFERLCGEFGIAYETIGSSSAAMGPQQDLTLTALLQTIENTDLGLLYECRDQLGLGYRSQSSMQNQTAVCTIAYNLAQLAAGFTPTYDDQLVRNNVTVTNWDGFSIQALLTAGNLSIQNPPNGVGNGYQYTTQVVAAADSQISGIAQWILGVGTVDDYRYPTLTMDMTRKESAGLFATLPAMRIGDYFTVTDPPTFLEGGSTINQLCWGYSETLNGFQWEFVFNCVPEAPWATGYSPGTVSTQQQLGGIPVAQQAEYQTSIAALLEEGVITAATLNNGITNIITAIAQTYGGTTVTVAPTAPSSPVTNEIWINSGTGLIEQWNGSAWTAITFNATDVIQAGTIQANLIEAGTLVASLFAAGIIIAGIVNGTTISGATLVADGTSGEILVYSGTPATGNLIGSWSGAAGTDGDSNSYPLGISAQALNLPNQSTAPTAVAGSSTFYSSVAGRPRFIEQSGNDSVLERSTVNVAVFSVGNTTTPTIISAPLNYLAGEGEQSSEYDIEIVGNLNWGTSTLSGPVFQLYVDGSPIGGGTVTQFTVGVSGQTVNTISGYRISFHIALLTTTTAVAWAEGALWDQSANRIPGNTLSVGAVSSSVSFASASAHTLQAYCWWSSSETGQGMNTYRTKVLRRM